MPITIKPIATLQSKFQTRVTAAGPAYADGVANPRRPWAASAEAAKDTWSAGVTQAAANDSYSKGVAKAGDSKWQQNAAQKGAQRFPTGAAQGANNWGQKIQPFLAVVSSLNLPPRAPKGDPSNVARVAAVATALHQKKISG